MTTSEEPILLVFSASFSGGEEAARAAGEALGHRLLTADEVAGEAARLYLLPAGRILEALSRPPSLFGLSTASRRRAFAFFSAALLGLLRPGRTLYHGPLGARIVKGVSHAIQVRLTASLPCRVAFRATSEGITQAQATERTRREDVDLDLALRATLGEEAAVPEVHDLTIDVGEVGPGPATAEIVAAAGNRRYEPMCFSLGFLDAVLLRARVRALVVAVDREVLSTVDEGRVVLRTRPRGLVGRHRMKRIERAVRTLEGVTEVQVEFTEAILDRRGETMR